MLESIRQFISLNRELSRGAYAAIGVVLMAIKYNIDRLVAVMTFDEPWTPIRYLAPADDQSLMQLTSADQTFFGVMLAISLPFILVGIWLTVRRLRSIGLPEWLVAFFFVPVVNLLLFVTLSVLPSGLRPRDGDGSDEDGDDEPTGLLDRMVPNGALGSAAMALVITVPPGIIVLLFGIEYMAVYGWGLFVGLPFVIGMTSVLLYGYSERRGYLSSMGVATLSMCLFGGLLIVLAIEGLICIFMAGPIGVALALMGGTVGFLIQRTFLSGPTTTMLVVSTFALVPLIMGVEGVEDRTPPLTPIETSVTIDAPPQVVWDHVVDFGQLPPPEHWIFKTGIAYPTHAEMKGEGEGAVRYCHFSTGPFVEPIHTWDEPHRLAFDVEEQPPSMEELTPFETIDAPHIDDFLVSERGEFLLEELPDGGTKLTGTTWYRHHIWPVSYWKLWSDEVIHRIHLRVLNHVKNSAEAHVEDNREAI